VPSMRSRMKHLLLRTHLPHRARACTGIRPCRMQIPLALILAHSRCKGAGAPLRRD
jgi:hypothetical protein